MLTIYYNQPSGPWKLPSIPFPFDQWQHLFNTESCCIDHGFGTLMIALHFHQLVESLDRGFEVRHPIGQYNSSLCHVLGVSFEKWIVASKICQRWRYYWLPLRIPHKLLFLQCKFSKAAVAIPKVKAWLNEGKGIPFLIGTHPGTPLAKMLQDSILIGECLIMLNMSRKDCQPPFPQQLGPTRGHGFRITFFSSTRKKKHAARECDRMGGCSGTPMWETRWETIGGLNLQSTYI